MTDNSNTTLAALLAEHHDWPCTYSYKFIVEKDRLADVKALFPSVDPLVKPSSKGRFVSVTFAVVAKTPDEVVATYQMAARIPGLISL